MMKNLLNNKVKISIVLVVLYQLALVANAQELTWAWQNPFPAGNGHNDVAWINDQTFYVSGGKGQFLKTSDFGQSWEAANVPTDVSIAEIDFVSATKGWVATDNGQIWMTDDAGVNWTMQHEDANTPTLREIDIFDQVGYAVGDAGFVENAMLKTVNGGSSWEAVALPVRDGAFFYGMFFTKAVNKDTVYAASWDNTFFKSYDQGVTWDTTYLPNSAAGFYEGGFFVNDSTGFIVGPNGYIVKTTDYGDTWDVLKGSADLIDEATHYLTEVFFLDDQTGWVSSFGCLYNTTDGGTTWSSSCEGTYDTNRKSFIQFNEQGTGIAVAFTDIYVTQNGTDFTTILPIDPTNTWNAIDEAEGELFVAGSQGEIFHSNNEGVDWNVMPTSVTSTLTDISFLDKNNGWVVGSDSTILKTSDGGTSWQVLDTDYSGDFNSIYAWNNTDAVVIGDDGSIFKTSDGGSGWTRGTIETTSHINAVHFANVDTGYVVGRSGLIAATNDGGLNWSVQDAGILSHLNDVFFANSTKGYAVGRSGQILHTKDAGITWTPQISGQAGTLNSVFFLDENNGFVTGRGFVLVTEDGGQTWSVQDTPSGNVLNDVLFIAPEKGWAVGSIGNVLYFGEESNTVTGTISFQENRYQKIKVYPNPGTYRATFALPTNYNGSGRLNVFSMSGRLMHTSELSFESGKGQWIIHRDLNEGIYPFHIMVGGKAHSGKISIRR